MWKPSPWRKFPSKGGSGLYAPSPVAFRRSRAALAGRAYKGFAEQNLALAEFISAKGWWIGAPMKRVLWGRRYCGSLHHGGNSPVNGGEWPLCAVSGRLPAQHGCARRSCVQGFCGAKPCFGGIHFCQRMVDRGPHETSFMGQAILWKPSPWRKFPSKRGSDPWREVFGKHRPFYGQFADWSWGSRDTTQEPPPDAL